MPRREPRVSNVYYHGEDEDDAESEYTSDDGEIEEEEEEYSIEYQEDYNDDKDVESYDSEGDYGTVEEEVTVDQSYDDYDASTDDDIDNAEFKSLDEEEKYKPPTHNSQTETAVVVSAQGLPGRTVHLNLLQEALARVSDTWMENVTEWVWMDGPAGVGKTTLLEEFVKLIPDEIYLGRGAFEERATATVPFGGLGICLNQIADRLMLEGGPEVWKPKLEEILGGEGTILAPFMPAIASVLEIETATAKDDPTQLTINRQLLTLDPTTRWRLNRLSFAVRDFLRTVSEDHPLVLILEDLHWMDEDSLQVLQTIISDELLANCLFVVTYKQPLADDHRLFDLIESQQQVDVTKTKITLTGIEFDATVQWLSRTLHQSDLDEKIQAIAYHLYEPTQGNPMWLSQYLYLLQDMQLLYVDENDGRLVWDERATKKLLKENLQSEIIDIIALRLKSLPKFVKLAITTAGTLGLNRFSLDELYPAVQAVSKTKDYDKCPIKDIAHLERLLGILAKKKGMIRLVEGMTWEFENRSVLDAAYILVGNKQDQKVLHEAIGLQYILSYKSISTAELHQRLTFLAQDQWKRAADLLMDNDKKRHRYAKLNLDAAEMCIVKSAFRTSLYYLESGLSILDKRGRWSKFYFELTLRLTVASARMYFCCGYWEDCNSVSHRIVKNGRSLPHKVPGYQVLTLLQIQQRQFVTAFEMTLGMLSQLGEDLPREDVAKNVRYDLENIRREVRDMTNDDLLNLPTMTDKRSKDIMNFLANFAEINWLQGDSAYHELAVLRMMRRTLKNGFSRWTAYAFSLCAVLMASFSLQDDAYRLGRLAERLAKPDSVYGAQALAHHHWNVSHWRRPYRKSLEPLLKTYNAQMDIGDFDHVGFTISTYISNHLASGRSLAPLSENLVLFSELFDDYDLDSKWMISIPNAMVSNLMGDGDLPMIFFGSSNAEQNEILDHWEETNQEDALQHFYLLRMIMACYFNRMDIAEEMRNNLSEETEGVWLPMRAFMEAMILLSQVPMTKGKMKNKLEAKIHELMGQLKTWSLDGCVNCEHMLLLVEAEAAIANSGKKHLPALKVRHVFDAAVAAASKLGCLHHEAWASERAGLHFIASGNEGWASSYLNRAYQVYETWGAIAKVQDLESQFSEFLQLDDKRNAKPGSAWRDRVKNGSQRHMDDSHAEEGDDDEENDDDDSEEDEQQQSRRGSLLNRSFRKVLGGGGKKSSSGSSKKKKGGNKKNKNKAKRGFGRMLNFKDPDPQPFQWKSERLKVDDDGNNSSFRTPKSKRRFVPWKKGLASPGLNSP